MLTEWLAHFIALAVILVVIALFIGPKRWRL